MSDNRVFHVDLYTKTVLTVIAFLLGWAVLGSLHRLQAVHAQSESAMYYVEPRVTTIRRPDGTEQVQGKVVIDLRNGDIWGFPTLSDAGYPVDLVHSAPPVSAPIYLGRFDFSKMTEAERERQSKH